MPDSIFRAYPAIAHAVASTYAHATDGSCEDYAAIIETVYGLSFYEADLMLDAVLTPVEGSSPLDEIERHANES